MAYSGSRLERIENSVRDLSNDDDSLFMGQTTQFIRFVNQVQRQIAHAGYWKKETSFDATTSEEYDLSTLITDLVRLFGLRWSENSWWMKQYMTFQAYKQLVIEDDTATGTPEYWFQQASKLYVWPPSDEAVTDGFVAFHSYLPTDLDTTTNYTPEIPEVHDDVYVYGVLWRNSMRDRTRPGYEQDAAAWKAMYDKELRRLVAQGSNRKVGLIPYR